VSRNEKDFQYPAEFGREAGQINVTGSSTPSLAVGRSRVSTQCRADRPLNPIGWFLILSRLKLLWVSVQSECGYRRPSCPLRFSESRSLWWHIF